MPSKSAVVRSNSGPTTTPGERLVALVDVAERLVRAAKRRGAPNLTPDERKVLDYWLEERDELERMALAKQPLCDDCPLHALRKNRNRHK